MGRSPSRTITIVGWQQQALQGFPFRSPSGEGCTRLLPTLVDPEQMADERKYREEEVGEIFDLATSRHEVGRPSSSDEGGLTLAELQEVGLEVGIEPSRIAEAALAVDKRRGVLPRRTSLGMPTSVGRVIELPGAVTDRKWELLIAELRETSGARGEVTAHGGVREWANGDLNAFLEPTETGHRLRLRARKGAAIVLNAMGVVGVSMGLGLLAADAIAEVFGSSVFTGDFLTGPGLSLIHISEPTRPY